MPMNANPRRGFFEAFVLAVVAMSGGTLVILAVAGLVVALSVPDQPDPAYWPNARLQVVRLATDVGMLVRLGFAGTAYGWCRFVWAMAGRSAFVLALGLLGLVLPGWELGRLLAGGRSLGPAIPWISVLTVVSAAVGGMLLASIAQVQAWSSRWHE